ncbi:type VII secretion integral membrane protein EccD [Amycolatopsis sp. H20-H5]|uniref:type VII secretion integral membrane protein EccD n=1 Tax=Amycolatopsis sp. H20-H5 TaxID=3046309 RepID=UPI002DB8E9A1|nr:type VII secretion integral membrane protein EccD [Amycolatopsis sp. H20-H5]MEC3980610.1 type VII secretion integral membrane protein EccD [Amycolatopsis sp. H20-H5]
MTSAQATALPLCRITVVGPAGRADLAVPMTATVADLLPVFVRHTTVDRSEVDGSWVLQRLGEPPLDPDATPESADLLEGEELYLRPAADPLPELDFDDVADGMATAMTRQADRWTPEFNRPFFLTLSGLVTAVAVTTLFLGGSAIASMISAIVLSVLLLTGAVLFGRYLHDGTLATMTGLGGCLFAGLAGTIGVAGPAGTLGLDPLAMLVGGAAAAVAAGALLSLRPIAGKLIAIPAFTTVAATGIVVVVAELLYLDARLEPVKTAALVALALLIFVVIAPKVAIRAAKVRGPQLPRTADELQIDIEPEAADRLLARAVTADGYLNVVTVCTGLVSPVCFVVLLPEPGWAPLAMVLLYSSCLLLRARVFLGAWQRVSLSLAGFGGYAAVVLGFAETASPQWRGLVLTGLLAMVGVMVLAALRAPFRRLLPIWGHTANILETVTALAIVPVLLQLLGVYAWARGLFG